MKVSRLDKRIGTLAALVCLLPALGMQCGDLTSPSGTVNNCSVQYDSDFPVNGSLNVDRSASCPFKTFGNQDVPYAAAATLPSGSVTYGLFQSSGTNRQGSPTTFTANAVWSQGNGSYYVNISGDYWAATGGFDAQNNGFDHLLNQFYLGSGRWTSATAVMAYTFGPPGASVSGPPTGLSPGTEYSLTATTDDPLVLSPVTWTWTVDGTTVGTTSDGVFSWTTGDAGTTQQIVATVTDANGVVHSGSTSVTSCTDNQIQC